MMTRYLFALAFVSLALVADETATSVSFTRDIRPLLSKKCFQCHGPDEQDRKAGLRLDTATAEDGAYRIRKGSQAIKPNDIEASELWHRIVSADPDDLMPPPESNIEPLSSNEQALVKAWIEQGADYEAFWAFVPPQMPQIPSESLADWSHQPIDRFIAEKLAEKNFEPSPEASKRTLIRRLSFDLTGLPPTPAEIEEFLDDTSEDAYRELVERLLAKPQYGEHMAKYWLDLVRFADTNGLHHDHYREMTPYRDWIIRAFNDNLGFNDFISYQVAGDLYPKPSVDQKIASGFNRLHLIIDRGTALPEESFTRNVVDRVTAVGTAFLGLTVQCAVCHDHKYDPITQRDFYQLFAFFNNFDGGPETGGRSGTDFRRGLQPPYIEFPTPTQATKREQLNQAIKLLEEEIKSIKEDADQDTQLKDLNQQLSKQKKLRDQLEETIPATLVMKERKEPRPSYILTRGIYDQYGEEVQRNTPGFLPPLEPEDSLPSRLDLAKWLTSTKHPLTARVTVNRFWQQFFGVGIVKTSEDFGAQGQLPSHPELLDYLTLRFQNSGWNVKDLVRSIVLSETYRQTAKAATASYRQDPENRLLSRGSRFRFDSEMIRDQILAVSGQLSSALYGKSVKPPQPAGIWKSVAMPSSYPRLFEADEGEKIYRRSVYTFWKRGMPPPQMTIFDAPSRESCIARRERTNTPLQALMLMNETEFFRAAALTARRVLQESSANQKDPIIHAYELITSQLPTPMEVTRLRAALEEFRELYSSDPAMTEALSSQLPSPPTSPGEQTELAAWTMLTHSLLNLDITKTHQ